MQDNYAGALDAWTTLLSHDVPPAIASESLYWSGKALTALNDPADARQKYTAAAAVRPVDFNVMRAEVALNPPPSSGSFEPSSVSATDVAELARWFAAHGLDLTSAAQAASQDPSYVRAQAMVQHGLYKAANWEYEILLTTYADKPDCLYWLSQRFAKMGLPNAALKLGTAGRTRGRDR